MRAAFIALLTPFIARLAGSGRIDTRILLVTGFSLIGASQIWLGYITTSQNDFNSLLGPAIMAGVGLAMLFVPISIAVIGAVPPEVVPKAAVVPVALAAARRLVLDRRAHHAARAPQRVSPRACSRRRRRPTTTRCRS